MAVFIKGMEMPESCSGCDINVDEPSGSYCSKTYQCTTHNYTTRRDDCPLSEVHIDKDLLKELLF